MEDRFNPFGLLILLAFGGACFEAIQEALDRHGRALYWPSFAPDTVDIANGGFVNRNLLSVPEPPTYRSGSALPPPPPTAIAQGGPAAPPAAPPPAAAGDEVWHIDRAGLLALLTASGGMRDDGCLNQPVIMEGMIGRDRVVADMEWSPGQKIVFAVDAPTGAVTCLEFAFDRRGVWQW